MLSFARRALLRLPAAAVKAQDELAALGLDRRCSQPNDYPISGQRKTSDSELAQPSITLEPTGFLMEGQVTH